MINISLICVGKIKERYLADGISEYEKRISKFAKIDVVEIEDERIPDQPSEAEKKRVLETEGNLILAKIPKDAHVVTLEIDGDALSSPEMAGYIEKLGTYENSKIVFIIGGSLGLSASVKERSKKALSFSKMTFPHQLMRLILLEQLYRSFSILHHGAYHK